MQVSPWGGSVCPELTSWLRGKWAAGTSWGCLATTGRVATRTWTRAAWKVKSGLGTMGGPQACQAGPSFPNWGTCPQEWGEPSKDPSKAGGAPVLGCIPGRRLPPGKTVCGSP